MESLKDFLARGPDHKGVQAMRKKNSIPGWDSGHPHGMLLEHANKHTLRGTMLDGDNEVEVTAIDCHGQILCNLLGYGNEEVNEARERARDESDGLNVVSNNFTNPIVEWARAVILESLGKELGDYVLLFVASGTEANDAARRIARAVGYGNVDIINLREGYSGSGYAANAACGHQPWKGNSTPQLAEMHFVDPTMENLDTCLGDLNPKSTKIFMSEAGNFGVGGFKEIPDDFLRRAVLRMRDDQLQRGLIGMDEVQTFARTGRSLWASETIFTGMKGPDMITMAKGLGNNNRAAAIAVLRELTPKIDGLTYHTFGQVIEDLAVMGTVIQVIERDGLVENARERGNELRKGLEAMMPRLQFNIELHGRGLMQAVEMTPAKVKAVLQQAPLDGWVPGKGGVKGNILRIAPPITIDKDVVNDILAAMERTFNSEHVKNA